MLSSYATKGIITINEARAALGRDPFPEAAADTPMVLTDGGYVGLGQGQVGASKSPIAFEFDKSVAWDEDQHPRRPAGSGNDQGGEFAPKNGSASTISEQTVLLDENDNDGCDQEWAEAYDTCEQLLALPESHPRRALLGRHKTIDGCAKGFVSERCGGNPF